MGGLQTTVGQSIEFLLRKETTNKQNELLDAQIEQTEVQTDGLRLQNLQTEEQTKLIIAQTDQAKAQTALLNKQALLADKELEIADQTLQKGIHEIALLVQQLEIGELTKQQTEAQVALMEQKVKTEKAQILDTIDGNAVAGIIGKQSALYAAQTLGFARDNKQKITKIYSDIYTVLRGSDDRAPVPFGSVDDFNTEFVGVLNTLKANME